MPKFRMTYPYARFWPSTGLSCAPSEEIEAASNPDPTYFAEVASPKTAPKPDAAVMKPDAPSSPLSADTEEH